MEGSGSSNSQVIAQIGLTEEESSQEVPPGSQLAVILMSSLVLTRF